MSRRWIRPLLLVAVAMGCAGPPGNDDAVSRERMDELRTELRGADVAMDRAVQEGDLEAFSDLIAEDAVFYGNLPVEGRDRVVESWSGFFDPEAGTTITWIPKVVEVAASGELGVTRGEYRMRRVVEDGRADHFGGSYVTVWRRSEDGKWRAAIDIGTPSQPIEAP